MNIKADIKNVLAESGMRPTELARLAGISQSILSRYLQGGQAGLNTATLEKLWPFLYGDKRPTPSSKGEEAA